MGSKPDISEMQRALLLVRNQRFVEGFRTASGMASGFLFGPVIDACPDCLLDPGLPVLEPLSGERSMRLLGQGGLPAVPKLWPPFLVVENFKSNPAGTILRRRLSGLWPSLIAGRLGRFGRSHEKFRQRFWDESPSVRVLEKP